MDFVIRFLIAVAPVFCAFLFKLISLAGGDEQSRNQLKAFPGDLIDVSLDFLLTGIGILIGVFFVKNLKAGSVEWPKMGWLVILSLVSMLVLLAIKTVPIAAGWVAPQGSVWTVFLADAIGLAVLGYALSVTRRVV